MSLNKLDRASLRRNAQRIESYSSLISKRRAILNTNDVVIKKSRLEVVAQKPDILKNGIKEIEDNEKSKDNGLHLSSLSTAGSNSDSSQEYKSDMTSVNGIQHNTYQSELEVTSVMTRSATRKYASVGAIHNRVNFDEELKVVKRWPVNVSNSMPEPPSDKLFLKNLMSRSLNEVMSFCKFVIAPESVEMRKTQDSGDSWELNGESTSVIDLSPYLTQEQVIINENDETQITLHLNDNFLPHQFINVISLNEEDDNGTLVIQGEVEDYETITLHSGETYVLDNKYYSNTESEYLKPNGPNACKNMFSDHMMAVHNDHTYALKYTEKVTRPDKPTKPLITDDHKGDRIEFNIENALNDLLLNTAILKCLICGETPQEVTSFIDKAKEPINDSLFHGF